MPTDLPLVIENGSLGIWGRLRSSMSGGSGSAMGPVWVQVRGVGGSDSKTIGVGGSEAQFSAARSTQVEVTPIVRPGRHGERGAEARAGRRRRGVRVLDYCYATR